MGYPTSCMYSHITHTYYYIMMLANNYKKILKIYGKAMTMMMAVKVTTITKQL